MAKEKIKSVQLPMPKEFDADLDLDLDFNEPTALQAQHAMTLQQIGFNYGVIPLNDAMDLKASAERIKVRLKRTAEDIIEIGKELIIAKDKCGHGNFETWLQAEFDMTDRSARRFIQVAETFGDKTDIVSVFNATALYALSAPSTPEEVRTEVLQRVENGEKVDTAEIERLKKEKADAEAKAREVESQNTQLIRDKSELQTQVFKADTENQRLQDDLADTKSALNLAITNIDQEAEQRLKEKLPELTAQATVKAKKELEMEYQDEIAEQQERIDSLKAQIDNEALTSAEIAKKQDELRVAQEHLALYNSQLDELNRQIAERRTAIQTDDDINNGYCNVLDNLIGGIAATLSQLDINIEGGKVTALCPLTNATLQKVDKAIAKLDDTMQILTLLLRTNQG